MFSECEGRESAEPEQRVCRKNSVTSVQVDPNRFYTYVSCGARQAPLRRDSGVNICHPVFQIRNCVGSIDRTGALTSSFRRG